MLLLAALLFAQAPPKDAPVLSEVNRLKVQNLAQRIELAQLHAQAAQREFDQARDELTKLVMGLKVEGYTLDLQSMTYVKDPPKTDAPPPPPVKK
jgi:hypothetical protein